MSADDIRIAWNTVTQALHAVHPDDGTYAAVEISFGGEYGTQAPADIQDRASAPGGRQLLIGPTLAEIRAAFEESPGPLDHIVCGRCGNDAFHHVGRKVRRFAPAAAYSCSQCGTLFTEAWDELPPGAEVQPGGG